MWKLFALTVVLAASAFATPFTQAGEGFCASIPSRDEVETVQRHLDANRVNGTIRQDAPFTVQVFWHVFFDQNNPSDGNIPDSVITQQMNVIKPFFDPVRLSFQVVKVYRRGIPYNMLHGAAIGNSVETYIKQFREGDSRTLNLYTVGSNSQSTAAGWATFPWDYERNPKNDGVIMDYNYLPGGKYPGYNTGKITVHEIGHWTGLLHTFQDGCNGGDMVADTPAEASPASGCPRGRDTCAASGSDPIENMMDYSDDTCRTRFTNGQYNRLAQVLYQYRGINLY